MAGIAQNGQRRFIFVVFPLLRIEIRSNHQRCSMKKGVIRIFVKFTGNSCDRASFLIKLQALGLQFY